MFYKIFTAVNVGLESKLVEVEADMQNGFPHFEIIGLGDKAVDEAKERVRSALLNSNFSFPGRARLLVNLAPADLKKEGTSYDLPIALSILFASGQIDHNLIKEKSLFVGELSLDGKLRHSKGLLPMAILAKKLGIKNIFLPTANSAECSLISGLKIYPFDSLQNLINHLSGVKIIKPNKIKKLAKLSPEQSDSFVDLADIKGQNFAKRALEIAAAGGHNLLMTGSPGSGKTLLAQAFVSILPPMDQDEILELTKIYSIAGLLNEKELLKTARPFRSPHHTISDVALIGGGTYPKPGEISLAHRGVLFLDELPEFSRAALESLRQPIEKGWAHISRAKTSLIYPAKFILVAAQNPCPCGFYGDPQKECICNQHEISRYRKKISGPLLDRIDIHLEINRLKFDEMIDKNKNENSQTVKDRVTEARARQNKRFGNERKILTNAEMGLKNLEQFCEIDLATKNLFKNAINRFTLSTRVYHRLLKISRTIADLDKKEKILPQHAAEAINYRLKQEATI